MEQRPYPACSVSYGQRTSGGRTGLAPRVKAQLAESRLLDNQAGSQSAVRWTRALASFTVRRQPRSVARRRHGERRRHQRAQPVVVATSAGGADSPEQPAMVRVPRPC